MPPPPRSAPPPPESSDPASTGQWELPSIPSGSLDFGDSGATSDLSASMWSEDSTIYPPAAPPSAMSAQPSISSKPPPPAGVPRGPAPVPEAISKEKLLTLHASVGIYVADAAAALHERSKREAPESSSHEGFVSRALSMVHNASPPQGPGEYGFLIYARTAAQVTTDVGEIMPGDIAVIETAKLKGHKGLHTYSMNVGEGVPCVGIVSEFDSKKSKFKTLQAGQRGGQAIVESVSYRLEDLKSGTIKVSPAFRIVPGVVLD
ncbi:hypothetical protein BC834DRAFT_827029 [Gloeopeniophorella convolvens]|nr:hypothetical protein BC834DRAFT_827029 [Gloeopeniophorella convolvens]